MGLVLFGGACLAMGVTFTWAYLSSLGWSRKPDVTGIPPTWEVGPELFVPSESGHIYTSIDSETKA